MKKNSITSRKKSPTRAQKKLEQLELFSKTETKLLQQKDKDESITAPRQEEAK
jgi:hypothetical protein